MNELPAAANGKLTGDEAPESPVPSTAPVVPRGRFVAGNRAALTHGGRSSRPAGELYPEAAAALAEREQAILRDLAEVSEVRRELVSRFVQASAVADSLAADFIAKGVVTTSGRTRRSVATYLSVLDRLTRLATSIGLERRSRDISRLSAAEWVAQRQRSDGGQAE